MRIKSHLLTTVVIAAGAGIWAGSASAATDPQPPRADQPPAAAPPAGAKTQQEPTVVGEVTVTARRVAEDIQKAPVAVTAVTPEQIQRMHPHDLSDLNHIAPNFTIEPSGSLFRNSSIAFARGKGYNNIDGTLDPALGTSVDGVFYLRNIGVLQDMFDLSGVEIVLGPQGTLYGKNTIAGVLNVTTQKPKLGEWEASGMVRFGNLGRRDFELVTNIPISDTLAARIAVQSQFSDGPYSNIHIDPVTGHAGGPDVGGDNTIAIRPSLRWVPSDHFDVTLIGTVLRNRSNSVGGTNESPPGSLAALFLGHAGLGYPGGPSDRYVVDRTWPSSDWFNLDSITAEARYHGPGFDIISVSNYMHDWSPVNYDDFTYSGLLNNNAIVGHKQYSEELRAQSTGSGPLQWVAGAYYDHGYYDYWQAFSNYIPVLFGAPAPTILNQWIFQWSHSLSGFAQASYALTDKLQVTGGLRVLTETKRAENYAGFVHDTTRDLSLWPRANIVRAKKTWNAVTYHADAKYQFTDDLMAYVSYSTGFHSGGFNSAAVAGAGVPAGVTNATLGPWAPEKAKSFEVGIRSQWFDRRLQANLTGFWTNYEDLQSFSTFLVDPRTGLTAVGPSNGGRERARGVELQAVAVPVTGLRLSASVGYLDAKFTRFNTTRNNAPYDCVAHGCVPVLSPDWTVHLDGSYDVQTGIGTFTPSISYSYTSDYELDTFNDPFGHVGAFGTVDAALAYEDPSGRWGGSIWGKNLTDKRHIIGFIHQPFAFTTQYFADPRTYGVELHIKLERLVH